MPIVPQACANLFAALTITVNNTAVDDAHTADLAYEYFVFEIFT